MRKQAAYLESRLGIAAPLVALTYDDGPSEWTGRILEQLAAQGNTATFFVIGAAIGTGHRQTLRDIAAAGCEIGIHGYSHRELTSLSEAEIREELTATRDLIAEFSGVEPRCWRPPYLLVDDRVRAAVAPLGLLEVSGTVMAKDWIPGASAEQIAETVTGSSEFLAGAIVVMHDGRSPRDDDSSAPTRDATIDATALISTAMHERGLRSVTVSELAGAS